MKSLSSLFVLTLFCLAACNPKSEEKGGNDNGVTKYQDQILSGQLGGEPWSFVSGRATISQFDSTRLSLHFWNSEIKDPCDPFTLGSSKMATTSSVLNKTGETTFGTGSAENPGSTITLFDGSTNFISTTGKIEILAIDISHKEVRGRVNGFFNDANRINGTFVLTYCE